MQLTSPQNPLLKKIRLAAEAGHLLDDGCVVADGPHLVEEALRSGCLVRHILATPESMQRFPALMSEASARRIETTEVAARAFQPMAPTEHSQGILALVQPRVWQWADLTNSKAPLVILDGIQDPGNAGTIVRSAEAFGATGVVFADGSVRIANSKFLRASAGSIFRLPFLQGVSVEEVIKETSQAHMMLYALAAGRQSSLFSFPLNDRFAFIVGSEGAGVRSEFQREAQVLSIPTAGVESLNAAVACSIALFEAARQRAQLPPGVV